MAAYTIPVKKKIFIAIPNDGWIRTALRRHLSVWEKDPRYIVRVFDEAECLFPLDNARNTIRNEFLETDFDLIWWIDNDIVPPIYAMDRLVKADKDIIGAVCFSMKAENGQYFPYPVTLRYNEEKRYQVYYGQGIDWVDAIGGACVMVKRHVYEQIERPYEFVYHRDGTLALTCDFRVWQKAQDLGYKIWVDFDLLCDHQKICSIKGIQDLLNKVKNGHDQRADNSANRITG